MNNKTLLIILGVAVVALVATLAFGGGNLFKGEGEDPALMMARSQGAAAGRGTPEPVAEVTPAVAEPEPISDAADSEPAAGMATAEPISDESGDPAESAMAAAPDAEGDADAEEAPAEEDPAAEGEAEATEADEASDDAEAEVAEEDAEAAADEDLMAEPELPEDPIERFKQMDPRDIIDAKYDDLISRQTDPMNEESEWYKPMTGRIDPLTRVRAAVPDDLKPPRSGETDENQIQTYLISEAATSAVETVAFGLQCHNVIQIGLQEVATMSLFGQRFSIPEGQGFSIGFGVNGINIDVMVSVTSISTSQVVARITGTGSGTSTQISKTQTYIPRAFYH